MIRGMLQDTTRGERQDRDRRGHDEGATRKEKKTVRGGNRGGGQGRRRASEFRSTVGRGRDGDQKISQIQRDRFSSPTRQPETSTNRMHM